MTARCDYSVKLVITHYQRTPIIHALHLHVRSYAHGFISVFARQTEIHTAEPFVTVPSAAEVEVAIRKLKSSGDKESHCFRPFPMLNFSVRFLHIRTLL
jgi:hypothetical protein